MEKHCLDSLVQEVAQLFAHSGLRLELLSNHYLAAKRGEFNRFPSEAPSKQTLNYPNHGTCANQTLPRQDCVWKERETLYRNTLSNYLQKHQQRIQMEFPHYNHHQVITKAAAELASLPQLEKNQYLRPQISQSKKQGEETSKLFESANFPGSLETFNSFPYFLNDLSVTDPYITASKGDYLAGEGQEDGQKVSAREYIFPSSRYPFEGFNPSNRMIDEFKMEHIEEKELPGRIQRVQGTSAKEGKDDNREKNDIYKVILGSKTSERHERGQLRGQQNKEKSEFPTLKSLFKKLQNTS